MSKTLFKNYEDLKPMEQNKLTTGSITPRPIAWVSTINDNDTINLAPFSFFSVIARDVLSISFTRKKGQMKDTLINILRTKEAVVNTASIPHLDLVNTSSEELEYGESEVDLLNIELADSNLIRTPRIKLSNIIFETKLIDHIPLLTDKGKPKADIVLLQILGVHLNPDIYDEENNHILMDQVHPASRLAGKYYGETIINQDLKRK